MCLALTAKATYLHFECVESVYIFQVNNNNNAL